MNKVITGVIVGLAMGVMSAASALDMSAGGGIIVGYDIVGQGIRADYNYSGYNWTRSFGFPGVQYGINGFFDATFVEVGIGVGFGGSKLKEEYLYEGEVYSSEPYNVTGSFTTLGISVLGKYNIPVPNREDMEFFPALGVEYQLCLAAGWGSAAGDALFKANHDNAGDFSQVILKIGAGYDYKLSEKMFLRAVALYGLGFPSTFSKDFADKIYSGTYGVSGISGNEGFEAAYVSNVTVKIDIGFKL